MKRTTSSFRPFGALTELDLGGEAVFVLVDVDLFDAGDSFLHGGHVFTPFVSGGRSSRHLGPQPPNQLAKGLQEAIDIVTIAPKTKA